MSTVSVFQFVQEGTDMKRTMFFSILALTASLILGGCSQEHPAPLTEPESSQEVKHPLEERARPLIIEMDVLDDIANADDGGIGHWTEGNLVELPAGSADALAGAIATVGDGGIVLVKSGLHTESDGVTIANAVRIVGEPGAVMQIGSDPYTSYPATLDPALHVTGVSGRVVIWGLEMIPAAEIGGVAILVEDSPVAVIGKNNITGFQVGIWTHHGDNAKIYGNVIQTTNAWQTGKVPEAFGITIANGDDVGLKDNDISSALFGVWLCDGGAVYKTNNTHDNLIGFILCKVPSGALFLPGGEDAGSENSGHHCLVMGNKSTDNLANGYLVIDGAYDNVLLNNRASANGTYDIELAGDSYRFGFLTPSCYDNVAIVGDNSLIVKDCGNNNTVVGGTLVDNDLDPCY